MREVEEVKQVKVVPEGASFGNQTYALVDGLSMPTPERKWFEEYRSGGIGCVNTCIAVWENAAETLTLLGKWKGDLSDLPALAERVAELVAMEIPANYPMLGRDAFRTGTGVHAAAIVKALRRGDVDLADGVYSAVPASMVNRRQEIEIGPVAGHSNAEYWLELNGYDASPDRISRILHAAKQSNHVLSEHEIRALVRDL